MPQFIYGEDVEYYKLIADLKSGEVEVREKAAIELGKLKDPGAVEPLIAALKYGGFRSYREIVNALAEIGEPSVAPLIEALRSTNRNIRENAGRAVIKTKKPEAIILLIPALRDEDPYVREIVAWALGRVQAVEAVEELAAALGDEELGVRRSAVWALGRMDDHGVVGPLLAALSDEDLHVRESAAWALRQTKDDRVIDALISILKDKNQRMRSVALSVLRQITGENFHEDPYEWEKWRDLNKYSTSALSKKQIARK